MRQTTNYQLPSWDSDDRILRTDFNDLTQKTDAALKANADAISSESSTRASAVSSLNSQMNNKGNCWIETRSYTGNGQYGSSNKNSLSFTRRALVVLISGGGYTALYNQSSNFLWVFYGTTLQSAIVLSSGYTFSWYSETAATQMNLSGQTYKVTAFCTT